MSDPAFVQQQQAAAAFVQQQQAAASQQNNVGSINLTQQQLQDMLASVGNQAAQQAVAAVQASQASHAQPPSALPRNILNLMKPPPYENKE
eukprot:193947-Pelagomonas_calceolata.AAC.1